MNNNLSDLKYTSTPDKNLKITLTIGELEIKITQAKQEALEEIGKTLVNKAMEKHNTSNPWDYKAIR